MDNLNKTATQALLQLSVNFISLETKNPLSSDLRKLFLKLLKSIQNGNETWYIFKSTYVEKAPIILFKMTDHFCWCQQKLSILRKCLSFLYSRFFNYIAAKGQ